MRVFFDASAFAKRYVEEQGSEQVLQWCDRSTELALSVVVVPELISAFCRLRREGKLGPAWTPSTFDLTHSPARGRRGKTTHAEEFSTTQRTTKRAPLVAAAATSPTTAASAKPWRLNTAITSSTAAGVHDTSKPPLVCGSVSSAWSTAAKSAGRLMSAP